MTNLMKDNVVFTSNLMKDNVVSANTFPLITNWQFAFFAFCIICQFFSLYVTAVKNGC